MNKSLVLLLVSLFIIFSLNGCGNIPQICDVNPEDIIKISNPVSGLILIDREDITYFLAGIQSLKLLEKSKDPPPKDFNCFEILLKNKKKINVGFNGNTIGFGDDWYYFDGKDNPTAKGTVELSSQGKVYKPVANWIYSMDYENGCADGIRLGPSTVSLNKELTLALEQLEPIPYSEDINITAVWKLDPSKKIPIMFSAYDTGFNRLVYGKETLVVPEGKGTYFIAAEVGWGTDYLYSGYQYIFKISR